MFTNEDAEPEPDLWALAETIAEAIEQEREDIPNPVLIRTAPRPGDEDRDFEIDLNEVAEIMRELDIAAEPLDPRDTDDESRPRATLTVALAGLEPTDETIDVLRDAIVESRRTDPEALTLIVVPFPEDQ